jgi:hypothetical protein
MSFRVTNGNPQSQKVSMVDVIIVQCKGFLRASFGLRIEFADNFCTRISFLDFEIEKVSSAVYAIITRKIYYSKMATACHFF